LHHRNKNGNYEKSKVLCSKEQLIYNDHEIIEAALGFIRFGCGIKSEEQEIIESLYDLYNDQVVLDVNEIKESTKNN
jgi:hypothetical protein